MSAPAKTDGGKPVYDHQINPPTEPYKETDTLLAQVDLSKFKCRIDNRLFRMRQIDVEPGGIVPFHEHGDRPALMYVARGNITEYNSAYEQPQKRKQGDVITEFLDVSHWWKNDGDEPVAIIVADLAEPEAAA